MRNKLKNVARKVASGAALTAAGIGSAFASGGGTGVDTTQIEAAVADVQTKGVAIAGAVTLMVFLIAAAKWLRRAK